MNRREPERAPSSSSTRALLVRRSGELLARDLHFEPGGGEPEKIDDGEVELSLQEVERRHVERILRRFDGTVTSAARVLGISRTTLYQKIRAYEIEVPSS